MGCRCGPTITSRSSPGSGRPLLVRTPYGRGFPWDFLFGGAVRRAGISRDHSELPRYRRVRRQVPAVPARAGRRPGDRGLAAPAGLVHRRPGHHRAELPRLRPVGAGRRPAARTARHDRAGRRPHRTRCSTRAARSPWRTCWSAWWPCALGRWIRRGVPRPAAVAGPDPPGDQDPAADSMPTRTPPAAGSASSTSGWPTRTRPTPTGPRRMPRPAPPRPRCRSARSPAGGHLPGPGPGPIPAAAGRRPRPEAGRRAVDARLGASTRTCQPSSARPSDWLRAHGSKDPAGLGEPPVRVHVGGGREEWRDLPDWPPPQSAGQPWYLASGRRRWAPSQPARPGRSSFRYDPATPPRRWAGRCSAIRPGR